MKQAPLEAIQLKDRIRQDFDDNKQTELANSIENLGLLQLPVCREEAGQLFLVAGERRLRAIKYLAFLGKGIRYENKLYGPGIVPYQLLSELPLDIAFEMELHENIIRQDVTWQERNKAIVALHELRVKQNPAQMKKETAEEIHVPEAQVGWSQTLVSNLNIPEVARAQSENKARRVIEKLARRANLAAMGAEVVADDLTVDIRCVDAIEGLKALEKESVDVFITDPPYGVDADKFEYAHDYRDSFEELKKIMLLFAKESFRVAAPDAHLYCFLHVGYFTWFHDTFVAIGWKVWSCPYIWIKDQGRSADGNRGPQHLYESVLFATKGDRQLNKSSTDVITLPIVKDKIYAAQKPVELYQHFLSLSALPGDTVLDPFCGSRNTFLATKNSHVNM